MMQIMNLELSRGGFCFVLIILLNIILVSGPAYSEGEVSTISNEQDALPDDSYGITRESSEDNLNYKENVEVVGADGGVIRSEEEIVSDTDVGNSDDDSNSKSTDDYTITMFRYDTSMEFRLPEDTKVAIFSKSGYIWFLFNKIPKYSNLEKNQLRALMEIESDDEKYLVKVRVPPNIYPEISYLHGRFVVHFSDNLKINSEFIEPITISNSIGEVLYIKDCYYTEPIEISDIDSGDKISVIPVDFKMSKAVNMDYNFSDGHLLHTYMGVAVVSYSDDLQIKKSKKGGIKIGNPQAVKVFEGEVVSSKVGKSINRALEASAPVYNFMEWKCLSGFDICRKKIQNSLLKASSVTDEIEYSFDMVELYLGYEMYYEAMDYLDYMEEVYDDIEDGVRYRVLYAAALYGAGNYVDAKQAFSSINVDSLVSYHLNELEFWKKAISAILNEEYIEGLNYLDNTDRFLKHYSHLKEHFVLLDLKISIDSNDLEMAKRIVDYIEDKIDLVNNNDYLLLRARLLCMIGDDKLCNNLFEKIILDDSDPKNQLLAMYERVVFLDGEDEISIEEAIKDLDSVRFVYRGSDEEGDLLYYLGEMHYRNKDYYMALKRWREMIDYHPDGRYVISATQRMGRLFEYLFDGDGAKEIADYTAVSVFYEYRELIPIGRIDIEITMEVIDRLVNLNLYEQAINFLKHLITFRLTGKEKKVYQIKLASLYMENGNYKKCEEVLDGIDFDNLYVAFVNERDYMLSRMHRIMGDYEKAKRVIDHIEGEVADDIRLSIYWHSADWEGIISILEKRLEYRNDPDAKLSDKEFMNIVQLSMGYLALGKERELESLRLSFEDLLDSGKKKIFSLEDLNYFIKDINTEYFDKYAGVDTIKSLISQYKNIIKSQINEINEDGKIDLSNIIRGKTAEKIEE